MGRNTSVGIATDYGLDGQEIESRGGARFSASVQTGPGVHPASCKMGTESFPGVMRPGRGFDQPSTSSAEVKRKSRAIPLFPLWIFVACSRVNVTLTINSLDKPFCSIKWHP
jgi:hypothetical protein